MEPRNRCQGINSASLCSLAGRYDNPIPTRCLAPIDFLKIPALEAACDKLILAHFPCSQREVSTGEHRSTTEKENLRSVSVAFLELLGNFNEANKKIILI
jgi:hypothetical protein